MIQNVLSGKTSISIVGLGYVGLPLAISFAKKGIKVIGFDVSKSKIEAYKSGIDVTHEVGNAEINKYTNLHFTSDENDLKKAQIFIVCVPTPVLDNNMPDLSLMESASTLIGNHMGKDAIVIYESTVYPGVTEDVCLPILEKMSGLKGGADFKVGYSPERINPGDKKHRLEDIMKVTSGMDEASAKTIGDLYEIIIRAGIHRASSIKVAEAAKVIENAQRDINIAFMNELSLIFDRLGIDTLEVLEAAGTKWNFLKFYPGLVGGHCIGVDPYYLANLAETLGYHAQVILSGRRINDGMGKHVAEKTIKKLIHAGKSVKGAKVLVMGLTFKEDCPDLRNSKVVDIIRELQDFGVEIIVSDPVATSKDAEKEYNISLTPIDSAPKVDAIILAVGHLDYKAKDSHFFSAFYKDDHKIMLDLKGVLKGQEHHFDYWRL